MNKKLKKQPISNIQWIHRDNFLPNSYNPNSVAPPENKLLARSVIVTGWCAAVMAFDNHDGTYEVIDGFHRWTNTEQPEVYALTDGMVPTVVIDEPDLIERMFITIRMNRARGTHSVMKMADMVAMMIKMKAPMGRIMTEMGMEKEEVIRLANQKGIPKTDIIDGGFSEAWAVQ